MLASRAFNALFVLLLATGSALAETWAIDQERSTMTVYAYATGLLSVFAHDHIVRAPIASGTIADGEKPRVEVMVAARELTVLDPKMSAKDRAKVQSTMVSGELLDVERFPEIRFRSTEVKKLGEGRWRVEGLLRLHGLERPLAFEVAQDKGCFRGAATLKQTLFGIQPISLAGGTIRVKDDVKVEFEICTRVPTK